MTLVTVSVPELAVRFTELLRSLAQGVRVQVVDDGVVVAELVEPRASGGAEGVSADAAVAEIVRDMIADGHPPEPGSPLWQFTARAA